MTSTTTYPSTVEVQFSGPVRGDVGPCCAIGCPNRATQKIRVLVNGDVETLGWVCDDHVRALRDGESDA